MLDIPSSSRASVEEGGFICHIYNEITFFIYPSLLETGVRVQGQIRDPSLGADGGEGLAQGPSRGSLVMLRYNKPSISGQTSRATTAAGYVRWL